MTLATSYRSFRSFRRIAGRDHEASTHETPLTPCYRVEPGVRLRSVVAGPSSPRSPFPAIDEGVTTAYPAEEDASTPLVWSILGVLLLLCWIA